MKLIQHTSNGRSLLEMSSAYSKKSLSDFGMKLSSDFSSSFLPNNSAVDLKSASSTSLHSSKPLREHFLQEQIKRTYRIK